MHAENEWIHINAISSSEVHHSLKIPFLFGHFSFLTAQNAESIVFVGKWYDRKLFIRKLFVGLLRWCNFNELKLPAFAQAPIYIHFDGICILNCLPPRNGKSQGGRETTSFASSLLLLSVWFRNLTSAFIFFSSRRRPRSIQINATRHGHRILAPHQHSFLFIRYLLWKYARLLAQ